MCIHGVGHQLLRLGVIFDHNLILCSNPTDHMLSNYFTKYIQILLYFGINYLWISALNLN